MEEFAQSGLCRKPDVDKVEDMRRKHELSAQASLPCRFYARVPEEGAGSSMKQVFEGMDTASRNSLIGKVVKCEVSVDVSGRKPNASVDVTLPGFTAEEARQKRPLRTHTSTSRSRAA